MENREIKFRAWNGEEMVILEDSGLQYYDFEGSYSLGFTVDAYDGFWGHEQYESATELAQEFPIMQYTGLKDKNGKEIYEGDIVKLSGRINYGEIGDICPIVYDAKYTNFGVYHPDAEEIETIGNLVREPRHNHLEIIGNIHENKDLL